MIDLVFIVSIDLFFENACRWFGRHREYAGRRAHATTMRMNKNTLKLSARTGAETRGETAAARLERVPPRYAAKGGACDRRLPCRTSSANECARVGGPVRRAETGRIISATSAKGTAAKIAGADSGGTPATFTPSGTTARIVLQHSIPCPPSRRSSAGLVESLWQHACSVFAPTHCVNRARAQ